MEILKNLLDEDESIFWIRETKKDLIPDRMKFERDKKREMIISITFSIIFIGIIISLAFFLNELFVLFYLCFIFFPILFGPNYPLLFGIDISHVYEFRNEFRFLNLEKLNDISEYIKPKKERYDLGIYFDLPEYKLLGDDVPNYWFQKLIEQEYREILRILLELLLRQKSPNYLRVKKFQMTDQIDF